jgi:non-specific serine/threonine protein kinase/serine/threonine-protein kinase
MKELTAERWKKINDLFHEILELSPQAQLEKIKELQRSQPKLASELEKLLEAHHNSVTFLSGTIADDFSVKKGERVGPWEIQEEIGRGGMSTVFSANRVDGQFDRKVAIKFLHGLFPGKNTAERMKAEQNILARLDHENICKLLDAGITENGRPYFIMEYIDGVPIDQYCRENRLAVDEILNLFEQICEAVRYAHQRLIVHRDLKPGNILVGKNGMIKLLDFGISKIVTEEPELDITNTKTALHLMTPEYASPEQVRYDAVTTSTDVYSLGLILCKLLTGSLPYDLKQKSPLEIGNTIIQSEPTKPSTLVTRNIKNGSDSAKEQHYREVEKSLRGDLDNIILMALRKDPERRYTSVDQLLRDIRNYKSDRPVQARPESVAYLAGKFFKRNRTGVAIAASVILILCLAVVFSIWQASIANEQRQLAETRLLDVRDLTGSLIFDVHDAILPLPGSTPARELIAEKVSDYLNRLSEIEGDNPDLDLLLAASYRKIGDLQGNPTTSNLGRSSEALESYDRAENRLNRIASDGVASSEVSRQKALLFEKKSDVLASVGELTQAEDYQRQSVALFSDLMQERQDLPSEFSYAISLLKMGDLMGHPNFTSLGMPDSSLYYYREAGAIFDDHLQQAPLNMVNVRYCGIIYERIGVILDGLERDEEALQNFQKSADYRDRYIEMDPLNSNGIRDRAISYEKMGKIYQQQGKLTESKVSFEKAFDTYQWLSSSDPKNTSASQTLAVSHIHLGDLAYHTDMHNFGDKKAAREHFRASRDILTGLMENDSTNSRTTYLLNLVNNRLD